MDVKTQLERYRMLVAILFIILVVFFKQRDGRRNQCKSPLPILFVSSYRET